MFFGTKLFEYQASFYDLLNLWCFYSITAPHYENYSTSFYTLHVMILASLESGRTPEIMLMSPGSPMF